MPVDTGTTKDENGRPCHSEPFGYAQDKLREESHTWL